MLAIIPAGVLAVLLVAGGGSAALAQARPASRPAAPPPASPSAAPPAASPDTPASVPQQTTASFADWTLRCSRVGPAPGTRFCEVAQGIQREDKLVAQLAIGRPGRGQPLQLTVLVPVNVSVSAQPTLLPPRDGEPAVELAWRRCLPGGCVADGRLADDALGRMRGWTEAARLSFTDGLGRPAALPFSPRGLAPALDALAKEDTGPGTP